MSWISVEDHLPTPYEAVLVALVGDKNSIEVALVGKTGQWWAVDDEVLTPTHWAPLPEPPK